MCKTLQNIYGTSLNRTEAKAGFKLPDLWTISTRFKSMKTLARQFRRRRDDTFAYSAAGTPDAIFEGLNTGAQHRHPPERPHPRQTAKSLSPFLIR